MQRRRFLLSAGRSIFALTGGIPILCARTAHTAQSTATSLHLAISDYVAYRDQPSADIQRRFDLYRQLGFGILRSGLGWRGLERKEGQWGAAEDVRRYFERAINSGFRLKLAAGALNAPAWFLDAHPDAVPHDAAGPSDKTEISPWQPNLRPLLAEKTDKVFAYLAQYDILKATDFIFVDLGFANQPTYPLRRPGASGCREATPWFYGTHAGTAFEQAMQEKYASLARANSLWGTNFATWGEVRPPRPGQYSGPFWNDALLWYRDSKRAFDRWQVANYRDALAKHTPPGHRPTLVIMVAGRHISATEWTAGVQSGMPGCALTIMSDSEFPMNLAKETGCWLQYTGATNAREVSYLRQYMREHGITEPMWGENAGNERVARNPERLVDVVLANGLYGIDYVNSRFLFESDGITPNETFQSLGEACRRLRAALG